MSEEEMKDNEKTREELYSEIEYYKQHYFLEKEATRYYKEELDTYYKMYLREKEKNKELENILAKKQWVRIKENGEIEPLFYVSKDKIKELQSKYKKEIEKLESKKIWNEPIDTINKNRYTNYFNVLEELLGE